MSLCRLSILLSCAAATAAGSCTTSELGTVCGLGDEDALVQASVRTRQLKSENYQMDVYVSTAETLEDIMFWSVLYKTMKPYYHAHPHWLLIRNGSEVMKRAHAIRMAIGQNFWHASVDVFTPKKDLNLEAVESSTWRQLAMMKYSPEQYRRVVHISPDSLAFKNIDDMTHRIPHLILAREQGDCRNLTQALNSQQPATNLYSMVPDERLAKLMVPATVKLAASESSVQMNVSQASLLSRAFSKVHPEKEQGAFHPSEVVSASCLMHHRDTVLRNKGVLDNMKLMYLGDEGKRLIGGIIQHGEKRLVNTLNGLHQAGKSALSNAVRTWFEAFSTDQVRSVIDAAKNGPLAEV